VSPGWALSNLPPCNRLDAPAVEQSMANDQRDEYLTIDQACAVFGLGLPQMRRLLREYGLGDFTRASMRRDVLIRRADLEKLAPGLQKAKRSGAA
jgi:excisionase family DNA binding protein